MHLLLLPLSKTPHTPFRENGIRLRVTMLIICRDIGYTLIFISIHSLWVSGGCCFFLGVVGCLGYVFEECWGRPNAFLLSSNAL